MVQPSRRWVIVGVGAATLGANARETIQVLPPRVDGALQASADYLRDGLEKRLRTWGVVLQDPNQGLRLVTNLTTGANSSFLLEALLLPRSGESPIFRKTYHASRRHLDRVLTRLVDDLSKHVTGKQTPAMNKMIAVRDEGHGVSEIVLTDAAGSHIQTLTHHKSLSLSPTSVRNGRFAYVTYVSGPPEIWGMDLRDRQPRKLYAPPPGRGSVSHPALSRDGSTLAFVETDKAGRSIIRLLDWKSGESRDLTEARSEMEAPAWSPDGKRLACLQKNHAEISLVILDRKGTELQRYTTHDLLTEVPSWSPDGTRIAIVAKSSGPGSELRILDLSNGTTDPLFTSESTISSPRWNPALPWMAFAHLGGGLQLFNVETRENHSIQGVAESHHSPRWVW